MSQKSSYFRFISLGLHFGCIYIFVFHFHILFLIFLSYGRSRIRFQQVVSVRDALDHSATVVILHTTSPHLHKQYQVLAHLKKKDGWSLIYRREEEPAPVWGGCSPWVINLSSHPYCRSPIETRCTSRSAQYRWRPHHFAYLSLSVLFKHTQISPLLYRQRY
jgi:hypothetical protein